MNSQEQIHQYLETLFHDLADNEQINVRPFVDGGTPVKQSFQDTINAAVTEILFHRDTGHHVFVGINPRDENKVINEKLKKGRGQKGTPGGKIAVSRVVTLFSDYDYAKMGKSRDQALKDLRSLPCPPSMIVDSGGGLQLYWLLVIPVTSTEDKALAEKIMAGMCEWWETDKVKDYSRILRVPGTLNVKPEYETQRECFIEQLDNGARYSLDELWAMIPEEYKTPQKSSSPGPNGFLATSGNSIEDDDPIPKGARSSTLVSIGGKVCKERTWEDTRLLVKLTDKARCDPPLQEDDPEAFGKVMQSVRRYWEKDSMYSNNGHKDVTPTAISVDRSLGSPEWYRETMGEVDLVKIAKEGIPEPVYLVEDVIPEAQYINMFGEQGQGKTWLAWIFTVTCIKQGKSVIYLDFENNKARMLERLLMLGATIEEIGQHLRYYQSPSPESWGEAWTVALKDTHSSLVISDGMGGILNAMGLNQDDNDDLFEFERVIVEPAKREYGATVLVLDHPIHATKDRPGGSIRKKNGPDQLWKVQTMDGNKVNPDYPVGIKLKNMKDRDSQLPPGVDYYVYRVGGDPFESERVPEGFRDKPTPHDERVLEKIQRKSAQGMPTYFNFLKKDLVAKKDPKTKKMPPGKMGETTLRRSLRSLETRGMIYQAQDMGWWEREIEPHAGTQAHQSENRVPASLGDLLGDDRGEGEQSLRLRRDAGEKGDHYLVLFAYQDCPNSTVEEVYDYLNPPTMPEENMSRAEVRETTLALLEGDELEKSGEREGHALYSPTHGLSEDEDGWGGTNNGWR